MMSKFLKHPFGQNWSEIKFPPFWIRNPSYTNAFKVFEIFEIHMDKIGLKLSFPRFGSEILDYTWITYTNVVIFLKYPFEVNHYTVLGVLDK